jgi:hypothetical protein
MNKVVLIIGHHPDKGCEGEVIAASVGTMEARVALGASRRLQCFRLKDLVVL